MALAVLSALPQDGYRNQGGFHMIGSGRDKIEKPEQLAAAAEVGMIRCKLETASLMCWLCTIPFC